jgi:predicted RNA-binding Zn ribbon-like protein
MTAPAAAAPRFDLSAGALCLDFANTVGGARATRPQELLRDYRDLLAWARQAGCLGAAEAARLARQAARQPARARAALARARAARERLYRVFAALARDATPDRDDLAALDRELRLALARLRLTPAAGGGLDWRWDAAGATHPLRPLWPVLRSAVELLTSPASARVRECAAESCSWLFLDRSHAARRRWCDMKTCGNRAKARRHYRRRRGGRRSGILPAGR